MDSPLPQWEPFLANSGAPSLRIRMADGRVRLIHSAEDPEREISDLPLPELWADVVVCMGTGYGYHLSQLKKVPRPLIIVLCDFWNPGLVATEKKLSGSVHQIVTIDLSLGIPNRMPWIAGNSVQVIRHPACYRACQSLYDSFLDQVFSSEHSRGASPINRVLLLHRYHFLQEELKNALEATHTEYLVLPYEEQNGGIEWETKALKALQQFRPTMVLSVNMKGLDPEGALLHGARRMGIPVHCWFVDDPRPIALAYPRDQYPWIQAWCWERAYVPWLKQKGFNTPRWLPLAADPVIFATAKHDSNPEHRLVFTGSAMSSEFLNKIRQSFLYDPKLAALVDFRAEELLRGSRPQAQILEGLPLPFQDERNRNWMECLIQHTASQKKRKLFLSGLLNEGLVCAGDVAGWQELLGGQVRTLPDIFYRNGLADHYRNCQINLNITSCQMPCAVNQRVFDVPMAGAFLLTDWQSDLSELFRENEMACFRDPGDLVEKSRWFLDHPEQRKSIIQAGKSRILAEHTYAHRLHDIFRLQSV